LTHHGRKIGLGKWHPGDYYPFRRNDRGLQEVRCFRGFDLPAVSNRWNEDFFDSWYLHNGSWQQFSGYSTDFWYNEASEWMQACNRAGEPFSCYLATNAPHEPCFVPARSRDPYRGKVDANVASYFAVLANIDENIGTLYNFLKRLA
jgi:arylsulfatase A-like enzyme